MTEHELAVKASADLVSGAVSAGIEKLDVTTAKETAARTKRKQEVLRVTLMLETVGVNDETAKALLGTEQKGKRRQAKTELFVKLTKDEKGLDRNVFEEALRMLAKVEVEE